MSGIGKRGGGKKKDPDQCFFKKYKKRDNYLFLIIF